MIGRIPIGNNENLFILTAIDHYTKWLEAKAIKDKSVGTVIAAIDELIIKNMESL